LKAGATHPGGPQFVQMCSGSGVAAGGAAQVAWVRMLSVVRLAASAMRGFDCQSE
jgi:hypothetical protein